MKFLLAFILSINLVFCFICNGQDKIPKRLKFGLEMSDIKDLILKTEKKIDNIEDYNSKFNFKEAYFFSNDDSILYSIQIDYPIVSINLKNFKSNIKDLELVNDQLGRGDIIGFLSKDSLFVKKLSRSYVYIDEYLPISYNLDRELLIVGSGNNGTTKNYYKLENEDFQKLENSMSLEKVYFRNEGISDEPLPNKNLLRITNDANNDYFKNIADSLNLDLNNINIRNKYVVNNNGSVQKVNTEVYNATTRQKLDIQLFKNYVDSLNSKLLNREIYFRPARLKNEHVKYFLIQNYTVQ
ncbi:hypothetical protein [Sphingobacterium cellulitidis]|uniref:hypothetical protein n=1 Tax=Sphingobacterium cellulitidis TaxID=1768011 RepID=UPI000B944D08|nr:hypothetical protein CHT99_07910 [Sphingobacterium cellulitidis]